MAEKLKTVEFMYFHAIANKINLSEEINMKMKKIYRKQKEIGHAFCKEFQKTKYRNLYLLDIGKSEACAKFVYGLY